MTIEEVKIKYSRSADHYISCIDCPLSNDYEPCKQNMSGFEDCWTMISNYMTCKEAHETNGDDAVNHPSHYTQGGIECIDAMKSAFGAPELAVYCKIAAFKYIWRCEHKNGSEDVKKAIWYLKKFLELKGESNEPV